MSAPNRALRKELKADKDKARAALYRVSVKEAAFEDREIKALLAGSARQGAIQKARATAIEAIRPVKTRAELIQTTLGQKQSLEGILGVCRKARWTPEADVSGCYVESDKAAVRGLADMRNGLAELNAFMKLGRASVKKLQTILATAAAEGNLALVAAAYDEIESRPDENWNSNMLTAGRVVQSLRLPTQDAEDAELDAVNLKETEAILAACAKLENPAHLDLSEKIELTDAYPGDPNAYLAEGRKRDEQFKADVRAEVERIKRAAQFEDTAVAPAATTNASVP